VPPAIVCCRYPNQPDWPVPNYPRYACIGQGGTPLCSASEPGSCDALPCPESLCQFGCLLGDFDGDGDLDGNDFAIFLAAFGHRLGDPEYNPNADMMDDDGIITLVDYQLWLEIYRGFVGNSSASAPQPGVLGDLDADGDVDLADFADMQSCVSSVPEMSLPCIVKFDFDGNQRVDLDDFAAFQMVFRGPQR
jgi:Ca2+-binding EF-hand superfamily protein